MLIAYFSWSGNTRGAALEIQRQTGADLIEIDCDILYSESEPTKPELMIQIDDVAKYDVIFLGYPNWWASVPLHIALFLEKFNFSGKTIVPFCSHGGGRFGHSLTAIAKLAPGATLGKALAIYYAGGPKLSDEISLWLGQNNISPVT